jgi:hypothetical protein
LIGRFFEPTVADVEEPIGFRARTANEYRLPFFSPLAVYDRAKRESVATFLPLT